MRRLLTTAVLLCAGLACDTTAGVGPESDTDTDTDTDTDADADGDTDVDPEPKGVQIGSEGIISDCTTRVVDGADVVQGFSAPAQTVAGAVIAQHEGTLDGGSPTGAVLAMSPRTYEAVEGRDCPQLLLVSIDGNLAAAPEISGDAFGWALVEPGGTAEFSLWMPTWVGAAMPVFDPGDFDTVEVRIDGDVSSAGLDAAVGFEGCVGATCTLEAWGTFSGTQ